MKMKYGLECDWNMAHTVKNIKNSIWVNGFNIWPALLSMTNSVS